MKAKTKIAKDFQRIDPGLNIPSFVAEKSGARAYGR